MGTKILYLHQSNLLPQVLRYFYTKNVVQYSMGYLSSDIGPKFCSLCIFFLAVYCLLYLTVFETDKWTGLDIEHALLYPDLATKELNVTKLY